VSRGPTTFRQRDVAAAIKAAKLAGCEVERVEITKDGKIVIVTSKGTSTVPEAAADRNEWDNDQDQA